MPLIYSEDINETTRLGLWHITEAEDYFSAVAGHARRINHPHKRLQHLAGRHLLKILQPGFPLHEVEIAETRRPFLPGEAFHFSISHCLDFAAVIISTEQRCGADVEAPVERIITVGQKALNDTERQLLNGLAFPKALSYTIAWSIKEAVFKWYALGGVDFSEDIIIQALHIQERDVQARVFINKDINRALQVKGKIFRDIVLMYVVA